MAGIKIHASIDVLIQNNRIHLAGRGLWMDWMAQGTRITGNLLYENSTDDLFDPMIRVTDEGDTVSLEISIGHELKQAATIAVTTELLGKTRVSELSFENPDGSPLAVRTDYFGKERDSARPSAGPFETPGEGTVRIKVW